MSSSWQIVLMEPARMILGQIGQFMVNVLLVIIVLIIGWVIAKLIEKLVKGVLDVAKIDYWADRLELASILKKGGLKYSLSEMLGVVAYWVVILVTVVVAINAVGLTVAAELLNKVALYVPHVIAAVFVLVLGLFAAVLVKNLVITASTNAGINQAPLLGKVVEVLIMVFAVAIAAEQVNIGARVIMLILKVVLGSAGLAAALAFGFGCQEIAAKYTSEFIEKIKSKK